MNQWEELDMFEEHEAIQEERSELAEKLLQLVGSEVKKELGNKAADLKWLQKERARISVELSAAHMKIRRLENEKAKFLKDHTKVVQRELFGGFTVGDVVYYAKSHKNGELTCETCNNTRKVDMTFGDRVFNKECPDCPNWYNRQIYEYKPQRDKVTQINTKLWAGGEGKSFEIYLDRKDGSVDGKVFLTEEECQVYCNELNEKERMKQLGPS